MQITRVDETQYTASPNAIPITKNHEVCCSLGGLLRTEFEYITVDTRWGQKSKDINQQLHPHSKAPLPEIHRKWRPVIFEWFYKIVDHFLLDRGVVAIAIDYFDRFLLIRPKADTETMKQKMYQLIAMSSLYIAMKLHGGNDDGMLECDWKIKRKSICLDGFVKLSRGQFIPQDILTMEVMILKTLSWKMNPPTVSCFLDCFMTLLPSPDDFFETNQRSPQMLTRNRQALHVLHNLSRYFVELAVCIRGITPYYVTDHSGPCINQLASSSISYAAMLLALDMMTLSAIPQHVRDTFLIRFATAQNELINNEPNSMYMPLVPECSEIQTLKDLIHDQFDPSLLLGPLPGPEEGGINHHPFQIAKKTGMFNTEFFDEKSRLTRSPTSPMENEMIES